MKKGPRFFLLFVCSTLAGSILTAEPLYVGRASQKTVYAPEDFVQTNALYFSTDGSVSKTGAGTWSVPVSLIGPQAEASLKIRNGNVALLPPGVSPEITQPAVLNKAAFWVDARTNVLTTVSNDTVWVDAWLDVRETGSADVGYLYGRAVPDFGPTNAAPILTVTDGMESVWFGGYKSGRSLRWKNAAGGNRNLTGIRHVFTVYGVTKAFGFLFGTYAYPPDFHIGDSSGNLSNGGYWCSHSGETVAMYSARTFVDGAQIDPFAKGSIRTGFHLLEVQFCGGTAHAENFFNDRNYFKSNPAYPSAGGDRVGGESLCEVLVFTNALSETERLDVETWLMRKWFGTSQPRTLKVALARDVGLTVPSFGSSGGDGWPHLDLTGCGTLSVTDSGCQFFCGEKDVLRVPLLPDGGDCLICPSVLIRLRGGDHLAVREADEDRLSGPCFSVEKTAAADTVIKSGDAPAHIDKIPAGVKTLSVTSGTLALTTPFFEAEELPGGDVTDAEIQNPGFETWPESAQKAGYHDLAADETYNGWTAAGPINGDSQVFFFNGTNGKNGSNWRLPLTAPEGKTVLAIKKDASVRTQITIPAAGVYRLSLRTNARDGYGGLPLTVAVGKDASSLIDVAVFTGTFAANYGTFVCRFPRLEAGVYQLWFKNTGNGSDNLTLIDDVRLTLVDAGDASIVPVPNGTFECYVPPAVWTSSAWSNLSTNNQAAGWTLTQQQDRTSGVPSASVTKPQMSDSRYYNQADSIDGSFQLMLSGAGGAAETTFTPPAGVYRLRADVCCWRPAVGTDSSFACTATVLMNDVETSLGSLTVSAHQLTRRVWPACFTVPEGTSVTLRLTSPVLGSTVPQLLADNFELVRVDMSTDDNELIVNGGFENDTGWEITTYPKSATSINGSKRYEYTTLPEHYGSVKYEGKFWFAVVQKDCIAQDVTFPAAGLYRFAFRGHSRISTPERSGRNPVRLWCSDGAVTNIIGTATPYGTNFVEYAFNFEIPKAGTYTVGLMGSYAHDGSAPLTGADHTTVIDGVSLKAVPMRAGQTLPDLPEDLTLQIAPGAKVRLDYSGTISIAAVQRGAKSLAGEISAVKFPDIFEGPGKIYVPPHGFYLIIR